MKQIHIIYNDYYNYTIISVILPHLQPDMHGHSMATFYLWTFEL